MGENLSKKEKRLQRFLEILPGLVSWNVILFPYWGIFVIPEIVAYFILIYNIYWFYQSFTIAGSTFVAHWRMQAAMVYDWAGDIQSFPDGNKVLNAIIIVTYREPLYILERTFESLAKQTISKNQLVVCLAMEKKEDEKSRHAKIKVLKKKYGKTFRHLFVTVHEVVPGEIVGKASNERFAGMWLKKKLVDEDKYDIDYITITSCDADHVYHPNHFAALTYKFLDNPDRYTHFWQAAVLFYNNIWELPAITRVPNSLGSIFNISILPRKDRLINTANYSLSLKLLDEAGYWDPDKIPEDWGIFFKAYYKKKGKVEVEPIYLPLYADAPQSTGFWKTINNQYQQYKRWAWGVSDDPWIIKHYFRSKDVPFVDKTMRLIHVVWSHFLWPVNWFVITIGLTIPTLINPRFARTTLGYTVPKLSSFVLTVALIFLIIMIVFDNIYKPKRPKDYPLWRYLLTPFEFVLMPISMFFFNALPGLDAHTRLMMGKYLEYRVTEKV